MRDLADVLPVNTGLYSIAGDQRLVIPAGVYTSAATLTVANRPNLTIEADGVTIRGVDPTKIVVHFDGCDGLTVRGLRIEHGGATQRNATGNGLRLDACSDFLLEDVAVADVAASGFYVSGCDDGELRGCTVNGSLADGIHFANASGNIDVNGCRTRDTGDDGMAVVSRQSQTNPCKAVSFHACSVGRSKSRGIAIVGGTRCRVLDSDVFDVKNAGIYAAHDGNISSLAVSDVRISGNTVVNANTYDSPSSAWAGIDVRGDPSYPTDHAVVRGNTIRASRTRMLNVGGSVAGGVRWPEVVGNRCIGPSTVTTEGLHINNTVSPVVADNDVFDASGTAIAFGTNAGTITNERNRSWTTA